MPLGPSSALLRSAIFRLTLINAGLLALAMVGAGLGGWLMTKGTVERDARDRISLEAHGHLEKLWSLKADLIHFADDAAEVVMACQPGFFDLSDRYEALSAAGRL